MQQHHTNFPQTGFVRIPQILAVLPISKSTWWQWVSEGKAPTPVKLGPKTTAWRVEDIRDLLSSFESQD